MSEGTKVVTAADWRTRCDYCGWPLVPHPEHGCWEDNCSMRPMPELTPIGKLHQEIRRLERDLADANADVQRLHSEKMDQYEARIEAEAKLAGSARVVARHDRVPAPGEEGIPAARYTDLWEFHRGVGGEGEHAYTWADKPHRLVYDLTAMVAALRDGLAERPLNEQFPDARRFLSKGDGEADRETIVGPSSGFLDGWGKPCEGCKQPVNYPTNRYMDSMFCLGDRVWHSRCVPAGGVSGTFTISGKGGGGQQVETPASRERTASPTMDDAPKMRSPEWWLAKARAEGDQAVSAGADLWPGTFLAAVRNLTFMARTSGGTAGRDDGLCAALDAVEALLPPLDSAPEEHHP